MNFIRENGIVIEFVIRTFLWVDFATIILIFLGLCINQEAGIAKLLFSFIKHWEEA